MFSKKDHFAPMGLKNLKRWNGRILFGEKNYKKWCGLRPRPMGPVNKKRKLRKC